MDWINVIEDMGQWCAVVNKVMNLQVTWNDSQKLKNKRTDSTHDDKAWFIQGFQKYNVHHWQWQYWLKKEYKNEILDYHWASSITVKFGLKFLKITFTIIGVFVSVEGQNGEANGVYEELQETIEKNK